MYVRRWNISLVSFVFLICWRRAIKQFSRVNKLAQFMPIAKYCVTPLRKFPLPKINRLFINLLLYCTHLPPIVLKIFVSQISNFLFLLIWVDSLSFKYRPIICIYSYISPESSSRVLSKVFERQKLPPKKYCYLGFLLWSDTLILCLYQGM